MTIDAAELVRPETRRIPAYNTGMTLEEARRRSASPRLAKLASNENPLGTAASVIEQMRTQAPSFALYPDPSGTALRQALAEFTHLPASRLTLGNGSEDLIEIVCRAVLRQGDRVVTPFPSFPLHESYAVGMGAEVVRVPVTDGLAVDVDAIVAALQQPTRMLILSNPMNPVGAIVRRGGLASILAAIDPHTLLVLDEAYNEFVVDPEFPNSIETLEKSGIPWACLRTFSKAYGLAGLRVGYAAAWDADFIGYLDRVRTPFNINCVAQQAAIAALADQDHVRRTAAHTVRERQRIAVELGRLGFRVADSEANFLFVDSRADAASFADRLLQHGIIVKPWSHPGFETFFRVSIGSVEDDDQFLDAMRQLARVEA